jgi:hypothetical protein
MSQKKSVQRSDQFACERYCGVPVHGAPQNTDGTAHVRCCIRIDGQIFEDPRINYNLLVPEKVPVQLAQPLKEKIDIQNRHGLFFVAAIALAVDAFTVKIFTVNERRMVSSNMVINYGAGGTKGQTRAHQKRRRKSHKVYCKVYNCNLLLVPYCYSLRDNCDSTSLSE